MSGYKEQRVAGGWWLISRGAEPWMLLPSSGEKHSGCFLYHSQLTSNARGNGHLRSSQTQSQAKGFFFCFPFPHRKQLTLCDFSLSAVNLLRTQLELSPLQDLSSLAMATLWWVLYYPGENCLGVRDQIWVQHGSRM